MWSEVGKWLEMVVSGTECFRTRGRVGKWLAVVGYESDSLYRIQTTGKCTDCAVVDVFELCGRLARF